MECVPFHVQKGWCIGFILSLVILAVSLIISVIFIVKDRRNKTPDVDLFILNMNPMLQRFFLSNNEHLYNDVRQLQQQMIRQSLRSSKVQHHSV